MKLAVSADVGCVQVRRKTTNRLRAIETPSLRVGGGLPARVARQLIAFGRLKLSRGRKNTSWSRTSRKTTNRLRAIETRDGRVRRSGSRQVARQLIAFGRVLQNSIYCQLTGLDSLRYGKF